MTLERTSGEVSFKALTNMGARHLLFFPLQSLIKNVAIFQQTFRQEQARCLFHKE